MNAINGSGSRRPKTRNQWDEFYEKFNDEKKRKRNQISLSGSSSDRVTGDEGENNGGCARADLDEIVVEKEKKKKKKRTRGEAQAQKGSSLERNKVRKKVMEKNDIYFVGDFVKEENEKEKGEENGKEENEKEKGEENGKEENEKEKGEENGEKGKEKEKENDKSKWLAVVDEASESRKDDTKTKNFPLVDSDSSDEVEFIGETNPKYKTKKNEMVKVISLDADEIDEKGDDQLLLPLEVKTGSVSGSKVGSVDGRSPGIVTYDEVASSTSKRRVDSISLSDEDSTDSEDFEDSSSSSSSSEDDDSEDGDYSVNVPSKKADSSSSDEEGKASDEPRSKLVEGVEDDRTNACRKRKGIVSRLRSSSNSKPLKKDSLKEPLKNEPLKNDALKNDASKKRSYSEFCLDEDSEGEDNEQRENRIAKNRRQRARALNVKEILLNTVLEQESRLNERLRPTEEIAPEENASTLPLKFRFPEADETPPEKEDWEVEIDNLMADLEMGRLQPENGSSPQPVKDNEKTDEATACNTCCHPGGHLPILDEQIGVICKYCPIVFLEIKHIYPDFAKTSSRRHDRRAFDEPENPDDADFELGDAPANNCAQDLAGETVWDLVPGHIKERMYQHQIDGFEFMWRNIGGDLDIKNLKELSTRKGKGCIISHAPGTGKTGLSVVFLQSFMKLFPMCRPVVIAPRSMLLTWENEFTKWDVDIPFHNLNNPKLSGKENVTDDLQGSNWRIFKRKSKGRDLNRTLKVYSWANGSGILGITYRLFEKLAGEGADDEKVRRILLKYPGLLVLDEGHTPRNDESLMWRALSKVETPLRIILSGTPFQNNFQELYNTLCLVSPDFSVSTPSSSRNFMQKGSRAAKNKWTSITSSIVNTENGRRIEELKQMISPFVHVHKGHILLEKLPGLRDALVHLKLTDLQQNLLDLISKKNFIEQDNLMTLISVHPSLAPGQFRSGENDLELDPSAGVKTSFVFELVKLCSAHGERVIVFSRLIEPLSLIKQQLLHHLKWSENRDILYMDGKIDAKYRQDRICAFNNPDSEAKVLLASTASCCEGINLIGASRIVLLDVVWNPSITRQAISRAYRLGQTKVVYVYNLISSTFEARKYECQARKDRMSELVFSDREEIHCRTDNHSPADMILEAMLENQSLRGIFERIVHQPRDQQILSSDTYKLF